MSFLFVEDMGPIEEPPLPSYRGFMGWCSLTSLSIAWILGFAIAHRFNGRMSSLLPFVANILPMSGLLWFVELLRSEEGDESLWIVLYLGMLLGLLITGIIAALVSLAQAPPPGGRGAISPG